MLLHSEGVSKPSATVRRCIPLNAILLSILLLIACVLAALAAWAAVEMARASRSLAKLSGDLDDRLVPLIEKLDVAADAVNIELLRIDGIVGRIEEITDRVESTSRTVQNVANAPTEIVTDIADRVRRAWKNHQAETAARSARRPEPPEGAAEGESLQSVGGDVDATSDADAARNHPEDASASV